MHALFSCTHIKNMYAASPAILAAKLNLLRGGGGTKSWCAYSYIHNSIPADYLERHPEGNCYCRACPGLYITGTRTSWCRRDPAYCELSIWTILPRVFRSRYLPDPKGTATRRRCRCLPKRSFPQRYTVCRTRCVCSYFLLLPCFIPHTAT